MMLLKQYFLLKKKLKRTIKDIQYSKQYFVDCLFWRGPTFRFGRIVQNVGSQTIFDDLLKKENFFYQPLHS